MTMNESRENYLEAILVLQKQQGQVRSIDVANSLGFSKPSVSVAMKHLREDGHLQVLDSGELELTESGRALAERVYERHTLLTTALVALGVSKETAREDACRIEHDISEETFEALKRHFGTGGGL